MVSCASIRISHIIERKADKIFSNKKYSFQNRLEGRCIPVGKEKTSE